MYALMPAAKCKRAVLGFALGMATALAAVAQPAWAKEVTFVTDFGINGRHAYFFVALDKGYYKQQGLDVTIVRGAGSADAIRKVAAGNAQMGFADAGSLVLARANDDLPVKFVGIVYQNPPHSFYALEGSGIKGPKDLVGKKVADSATSSNLLMFGSYAKMAGVDKDEVNFVIAEGSALPAMLATGRADAIGQYSVGEPLLAKVVAPRKLIRLAFRDVGLDFYSNGLITSEAVLKSDPDLVRKFVAATLKGMQDAFGDPVAAGETLNRLQKQVDADVGTAETRAVAELAQLPGVPLAHMDTGKMQKTVDIVAGAFRLKRPVAVNEMMVPGFLP
jgi:NitT/TauT family transport system substrate-binding protein